MNHPSTFPYAPGSYDFHDVGAVGDRVAIDPSTSYGRIAFGTIRSITKTQVSVLVVDGELKAVRRFSLRTLREARVGESRAARLIPAAYGDDVVAWTSKAKADRSFAADVRRRIDAVKDLSIDGDGIAVELRAIADAIEARRSNGTDTREVSNATAE